MCRQYHDNNVETAKYAVNYNQNPVVKLALDKNDEGLNKMNTVIKDSKGNLGDPNLFEVAKINSQKRVVYKNF
jgi:hypothetical protein